MGRVDGSISQDASLFPGQSGSSKQKMDVQTLFFNAYFDIKTGTQFTPYIGGGIGLAMIDVKSGGMDMFDGGVYTGTVQLSSKSQTNFAWNIGAGIGWDITEAVTLDLGYRYMMMGEAKRNWAEPAGNMRFRTNVDDVNVHQVLLGLRYTF